MDIDKLREKSELKQLDKMEEFWNNKIDKELKEDEEINDIVDSITAELFLSSRANAVIDNRKFIIACKIIQTPSLDRKGIIKQVLLVCTDVLKYELVRTKYRPALVKSDYVDGYDTKANIRTAVEGWVRHITGNIKPEMLEE